MSAVDIIDVMPLSQAEWDKLHGFVDQYLSVLNTQDEHRSNVKVGFLLSQEHGRFEQASLPTLSSIFRRIYEEVFCVMDTPRMRCWETVVTLLGRRNSNALLKAIYLSCPHCDGLVSCDALADCYSRYLSFATVLCNTPTGSSSLDDAFKMYGRMDRSRISNSMALSLHARAGNAHAVSISEFKSWMEKVTPDLLKMFTTTMHSFFFGGEIVHRSPLPWHAAALDQQDKSSILTDLHLTQFGLMGLGGKWRRLYSSDDDAISFRALQESLLRYVGPTILLLQSTAGDKLGFYARTGWKSSSAWYGDTNEDSFLFTLEPIWQVYYPIPFYPGKTRFLNLPPSDIGGCPIRGLAIGGVAAVAPRLHLNDKLERCQALPTDLAFENGPLLTGEEVWFDPEFMEVWAVQSDDDNDYQRGLQLGQRQLYVSEGLRAKIAHVDRRPFWEHFRANMDPHSDFFSPSDLPR